MSELLAHFLLRGKPYLAVVTPIEISGKTWYITAHGNRVYPYHLEPAPEPLSPSPGAINAEAQSKPRPKPPLTLEDLGL